MARGTVLSAAERIQAKYGMKWDEVDDDIFTPPPSLSTGSLLLNQAIGDCLGYPEGSVIEIFGPQHSGKTLMGFLAIAEAQKQWEDRQCIIIDAEKQFRFQSRWAQKLGVQKKNLLVCPTNSAEQAFDLMEMAILGDVELDKDKHVKKVVEPGNIGLILVDSVANLVPLEEIHKSMDQSTRLAALAAAMGRGLRQITSAMVTAESKAIIIFINQTRTDPNIMFGSKETRTGGKALAFYNTIAFRAAKVNKSEERDDRGLVTSHQMKIKFDKNKAGDMPSEAIVIKVNHDGTGVDQNFELFSVALNNGIIDEVKKGRYLFVDKDGNSLDESIKSFYKSDFDSVLEKHPNMRQKIMDLIQKGYICTEDVEEEEVDDVDGELVLVVPKDEKPEDNNIDVEKKQNAFQRVKEESDKVTEEILSSKSVNQVSRKRGRKKATIEA